MTITTSDSQRFQLCTLIVNAHHGCQVWNQISHLASRHAYKTLPYNANFGDGNFPVQYTTGSVVVNLYRNLIPVLLWHTFFLADCKTSTSRTDQNTAVSLEYLGTIINDILKDEEAVGESICVF